MTPVTGCLTMTPVTAWTWESPSQAQIASGTQCVPMPISICPTAHTVSPSTHGSSDIRTPLPSATDPRARGHLVGSGAHHQV